MRRDTLRKIITTAEPPPFPLAAHSEGQGEKLAKNDSSILKKSVFNMPPSVQHQILLVITSLFNNLVFGFALLFSIVVMPGLSNLSSDLAYLQTFQAIDGIIQDNQPLFILTWIGSLLTLVLWVLFECKRQKKIVLEDLGIALLGLTGHMITIVGNIPLNNRVHILNLVDSNNGVVNYEQEREIFEQLWNSCNNIRTVLFGFVSIYLLVKLLRYNPGEESGENLTEGGVL